jgi:hypothetical protein
MQALQFDSCTDNFFFPVDGTSCACPSAAGIIGLLNQARHDAGKSALGFLNPLLYKMGPAATRNGLSDITDGKNDWCGAADGFSAAAGWDPVTGWGSLNYGKMKGPWVAAGNATVPTPAPATPTPAPATPTPGPATPTPGPPPPVPTPVAPTPAAPTPAPGLKCTETSEQKFPCQGQQIETEAACKAYGGGGKCCWDTTVITDIWCFNPLT